MQRDSSASVSKTKKKSVLKCKKPNKNFVRKFRRRKNKTRYYKALKHKRFDRKTQDLCESVAVIGITDMEWSNAQVSNVPTDVAEWQKHEQLAYWKSRALSLEYENRMLYNHLKHVYATQINEQKTSTEFIPVNYTINKTQAEQKQVIPKEPQGKKRREELKKIYGDQYEKILGMETAVQLNFERHRENTKAAHWPNIPLKL